MAPLLSRRAFLAAPLPLLIAPRAALAAPRFRQPFDFSAELGIFFNLFTFSLRGTAVKEIDQTTGRYRVTISGEGNDVSVHTDASGMIRQGRFIPRETHSHSTIHGRESRVDLLYDHDGGKVEYHLLTHTFFLGRRRQVDDVLKLPPDRHVDDLLSAEMNFAANMLDQETDGTYSTVIVRRARPDNEGFDDVSPSGYRAELIPLRFKVTPDEAPGRLRALVDITSFSAWARRNQPARITFGPDRHLESVVSKLMLGTTFTAHLAASG